MIESPVLIELLDDTRREVLQQAILQNLEARFSAVPEILAVQVRAIQVLDRLQDLHRQAAICADLDAFRARLES